MVHAQVHRFDLAELLPVASECTVLSPSGTVLGKGRVIPREQEHTEEAYSVQIAGVTPKGVLESLMYADRPEVALRLDGGAELDVRLDHITGAPSRRRFFCHLR